MKKKRREMAVFIKIINGFTLWHGSSTSGNLSNTAVYLLKENVEVGKNPSVHQ